MIYVDDINIPARVRNGDRWVDDVWCHLVSDVSDVELHRFAVGIGLERAWFQHPGDPIQLHRHYDVTRRMRAKAVAAGAREITTRELVRMINAARVSTTIAPVQGRLLDDGG